MATPNVLDAYTFTGADGTGIGGQVTTNSTWTIFSGNFLLFNGRGRGSTSGNSVAYSGVTVPNNYSVKTLCHRVATNGGQLYGPAARCSTTQHTYYNARWNPFDDAIQLYSFVANVGTLIGSYAEVTPGAGSSWTLELRCLNDNIQVYRDGTKVIDVVDTSIASGKPGIRGSNVVGTGTGVHLDDFEVNDAATGVQDSTLNGSKGQLSGTVNVVNKASGSLQGAKGQLQGSASQPLPAVSASGTLTGKIALLSGTPTIVHRVQGTLTGTQGGLTGNVYFVSRVSGTLQGAAPTVQGTLYLVSRVTGTLTGKTGLISGTASQPVSAAYVSGTITGSKAQLRIVDYTTSTDVTVLLDDSEVEIGAELSDLTVLYDSTSTITMYTYATVPDSLIKDASANHRYTFNWTPWLGTRTISSATVTATGLTVLATQVVSGNKVVTWLGGGTAGQTYDVKCTINFTPEEGLAGGVPGIESRTITLKVEDR